MKTSAEAVEQQRDEWKARAEQATQLIPRYAMLDIWVALGRDSIHFDDWYDEHGYADAWAELTAAVRGARTAPAVTRDEIEAAIRSGGDHTPDLCDCTEWETCEGLADATAAVWALVSGGHVLGKEDDR